VAAAREQRSRLTDLTGDARDAHPLAAQQQLDPPAHREVIFDHDHLELLGLHQRRALRHVARTSRGRSAIR
jgi:hypothetical protein